MNNGRELSKVELAIELHEKGWSFRKIARRLEVSVGTAFNYVTAAYEEYPEIAEKRDKLRALELARIDRVIRRADKALRGTDDEVAIKAGTLMVKASESRRKLLGLDAPEAADGKGKASELSDEQLLKTIVDARPELAAMVKDKVH